MEKIEYLLVNEQTPDENLRYINISEELEFLKEEFASNQPMYDGDLINRYLIQINRLIKELGRILNE